MAEKKKAVKIATEIKETIEEFAKTLENKPKDVNDFLASKFLGLTLELYPEDINYDCDKVLKNIIDYCEKHDCLYAYCLHDSDFFTENTFDANKRLIGRKGEKKQNHYHVVVQFNYPTVIGDFVAWLKLDDENKFSRFIKKLKKPIEVDNMLLYLSHIKYPSKHQYHKNGDITDYIKSNRLDYVNYLHLTYHPKSAIKYAIKLTEDNVGRYIQKKSVFLACDEAEIGYDDYLKAYRVVKDIIDEHNKALEIIDPKLEQAYIRLQHDIKQEIDTCKINDKRIKELAETFGMIKVEFDGKEFMVVNMPEKKKLFEKPLEDQPTINIFKQEKEIEE